MKKRDFNLVGNEGTDNQELAKMDLDIQVSKLKLLKANHTSQRYRLEDNIAKHYPMQITALKERLQKYCQNAPACSFPDCSLPMCLNRQ